MTSLRHVLRYQAVIGEFCRRTDLKVVGTRYMEGEITFLFSDGEYYSVKAMEDTNLS